MWNLDFDLLAETICRYAGRNLTHKESAVSFPDIRYRKTCRQWPEAPDAN